MPDPRRGAAAALLLAAALAGCERARRPSDAPGADALTGAWSAELVVMQPLAGRGHGVPAPTVQGTISLLRDDSPRRVRGLSGPPTHVGAQTVHLRPFGFELRPGGEVPGVAARWIGADSVELAFESGSSDHTFTIRGQLGGDSITGRWHYSSRASGGAFGSVVMRRNAPAPARIGDSIP